MDYAPVALLHELEMDADRFGVSVWSFCEASMKPPAVIQTFPMWSGDGESMQISCVGVGGEEVMVFPFARGRKSCPAAPQCAGGVGGRVGSSSADHFAVWIKVAGPRDNIVG